MNSKGFLGVGVIGINIRGQHSYEQILKNDPRVKIVACSHYPEASDVLTEGTDENFRKEYARKLGAEYYEDYRRLLERDDIRLISLMCEPSRALDLGKECFDAGKDVLRDKPMTATASQGYELINYAKKKNKILLVALPLRFYSALAEVKKIVSSDQIGKIIAITMHYIWTNGPLEGFIASRDYLNAYGGGDVKNAGYHAADYLNWLIDSEPASVYCKQNTFFYEDYKKVNMEDLGKITIVYKNDVIVNLITGRIPAKTKPIFSLDISGTKGAIELKDFRATFRLNDKAEYCDNNPLELLASSIVDAVLYNRFSENLATGEDGVKANFILDLARKSAELGYEVKANGWEYTRV